MDYRVVQDYFISELGVTLQAGDQVRDGDCDPDLMAELVSKGVIEPVYATSSTTMADFDLGAATLDEAVLGDDEGANEKADDEADDE